MIDYAFFALLFAVATALAPPGATEVMLENTRDHEQRIEWTRQDDGRWAMHVNERDVGHFIRRGNVIVHETGVRDPDRYPLSELLDAGALRRDATRIEARGQFGPAVLQVRREGGAIRLSSSNGTLLPVPLRLIARP